MKLLTELDSLDNVKDGEIRKLITKATSSGSGNVVSSVSVSGDTVTYTKGVTALTAHQNAFSNVKVGSTTVAADSAGDTLELVAGSNITLTPDATNDKVTIAATNIYNKSEVDSLISAVSTMDIQVVQTLPTQDISTTTIYLVPKTASINDAYDEYIYVNNSWEHIGSTEVDLSNYYTKTQTDNLLDAKANASSLSTVATTGSYNDLSNKPTIPTKTSDLTNDSGFIDGLVILSYGNSTWNDFITAYQKNKVVYCRASSNSNPASGSQTRLAFMAYVNNATSPSNVEFQYYRSLSSPSVSSQPDEVYVYTLTSANKWSTTTRKASSTIAVGTGLSRRYTANTRTMTLSVDTSTMAQKSDLPTKTSDLTNDSGFITGYTETDPVFTASAASGITSSDITNWNSKQTALVSGTNIKTINNESLLGSGNINITSGGGSATDVQINGSSIVSNDVANLSVEGNYNASTNKIATMSEIPTVPTTISSFTNDSGYITGITGSDVIDALEYTPAAEPNIYAYNSIRQITSTSDQTYIDLIDDITNNRPIIIRVGMVSYAKVVGTTNNLIGTELWFMTSDNSYTKITLTVSGTSVTVTTEDIEIPTATSDLTNDSNFAVTNADNKFSVGQTIAGETVVDSIRSKNMLNLLNFVSLTANGVTFTNNGDGSITINGTASADFGINFALFKIKAGNYYLSTNESSTLPNVFYLYDHDGNVGFGNGAITLSQDYNKMGFDTWITNGTSFNNITISPQLETGSTGTTFAPYQNLTGQENYSTGEIAIGTWIDGKTLYRKVISDTVSTTNGAWKDFNLFSSNEIDTIVSLVGTFTYAGGATVSIPYTRITGDSYSNREYILAQLHKYNGTLSVIAYQPSNYSGLMSGQKFRITIEYTKN